MNKYRDHFQILLTILAFIIWVINLVQVAHHCGFTHPILIRELMLLLFLAGNFYLYFRGNYAEFISSSFRGRSVQATEGDKLFLQLCGPWISILIQLALGVWMAYLTWEKLFDLVNPQLICEFKRGFR